MTDPIMESHMENGWEPNETEMLQMAHEKIVELEAENARLTKEMGMALLHLEASRCKCGEPLKETDAADTLRDALGDPTITVHERRR